MDAEAFFYGKLLESEVPPQLHDGLVLYLAHHIQPGHFLTAVLSNDLREAVNRADDTCQRRLVAIVRWLQCYAPHDAWGSAGTVNQWLAQRQPVAAGEA